MDGKERNQGAGAVMLARGRSRPTIALSPGGARSADSTIPRRVSTGGSDGLRWSSACRVGHGDGPVSHPQDEFNPVPADSSPGHVAIAALASATGESFARAGWRWREARSRHRNLDERIAPCLAVYGKTERITQRNKFPNMKIETEVLT
jgi:hypothetical protein